jgi:GrpB-like predicted nucleotidyltransferase (UPF0157 family)
MLTRQIEMDMRYVKVVQHDPMWSVYFMEDEAKLRKLLINHDVKIHHVGSTAIPTIHAKPIIDILVGTGDTGLCYEGQAITETVAKNGLHIAGDAKVFASPMTSLVEISDINNVNFVTEEIHIAPRNSNTYQRFLLLKDYMLRHPAEAEAYNRLKLESARRNSNFSDYTFSKDDLLEEMYRNAKIEQDRKVVGKIIKEEL